MPIRGPFSWTRSAIFPSRPRPGCLRALQEKKIQRVGGNEEIPVDIRFICATNQSLSENVKKGKFREDLFFRINVFPIELPPLRERADDVILLARHFLRRLEGGLDKTQFSSGALRVLKEYTWPGNVRELANAVERAMILARGTGKITSETLSFLETSHPLSDRPCRFSTSPGGDIAGGDRKGYGQAGA